MHGKATLILTDKDTGRVVERIEEHNMVTNALSGIFKLPNEMAFNQESRRNFNGFLPMYKNVLKGLILFGDNVPENASDFLLGGKYSVLGTAGDEYSGSDAMRGTFNSNQSCEIENGYRFVWDFAPEKALGTIKALSLTNRVFGNCGNPALAGADSPFLMHPTDLSGSNNTSVPILSGAGNFFLEKDRRFYSYSASGSTLTIRKYRMSDPLALKICDTVTGVLESETAIQMGLSITATTSRFSYDPITERLYATYHTSATVNGVQYYKFRYAKINPLTCEKEADTDYITSSAPYNSTAYCAVYGGKIYFPDSSARLSVCSLDGALERTIDFGAYSITNFDCVDGKLAVNCKYSSAGRSCLYFPDEPSTSLIDVNSFKPIHSSIMSRPYFLVTDSSKVYVMLRTDYLATINNLAAPLEKTDQHALQVRYEITNE